MYMCVTKCRHVKKIYETYRLMDIYTRTIFFSLYIFLDTLINLDYLHNMQKKNFFLACLLYLM